MVYSSPRQVPQGNQGGLRAAALSSFGLEPVAFVATSSVIGVLVDLARTPVYLEEAGTHMAALWPVLSLSTAAVVVGTLYGERLLFGLSQKIFRRIVSGAIGILGLWFLLGPAK